MKQQILKTRLDLNILLNHLLFRAKLDDLSEEKREAILRDSQGVESALNLLKTLEAEIEKQYKLNSRLYVENLRLKKTMLKEENYEI
jgi:hypothetical protein